MGKLIYAQTIDGKHTILKDGRPKVIGQIRELNKRYKADGTCAIVKTIILDYDQNNAIDRFFFEDDKLVYSSISLITQGHILNVYRELSMDDNASVRTFLEKILKCYVFREMGFAIN